MTRHVLRQALVVCLCGGLVMLGLPACAEMIATQQLLVAERSAHVEAVAGFIARDEVRAQLETLGVDPADAQARIAALTDAELQFLADHIESQPAGGVLGLIGAVFVVLLVLELVGAIDLFKKI